MFFTQVDDVFDHRCMRKSHGQVGRTRRYIDHITRTHCILRLFGQEISTPSGDDDERRPWVSMERSLFVSDFDTSKTSVESTAMLDRTETVLSKIFE